MRDLFIEIAGNIRRNKMRTCLTGFAVSWGIFMLIVLLGAGNGLMNAFLRDAQDVSVNTMQIGGNRTSKPYDGLKEGRRIRLDAGDVDLLRGEAFADVIDDVSPTVSASASVVLSDKYFSTTLQGDYPERVEMDGIRLLHGRFVNSRDIRQKRKIIVLPSSKAEQLVHIRHLLSCGGNGGGRPTTWRRASGTAADSKAESRPSASLRLRPRGRGNTARKSRRPGRRR